MGTPEVSPVLVGLTTALAFGLFIGRDTTNPAALAHFPHARTGHPELSDREGVSPYTVSDTLRGVDLALLRTRSISDQRRRISSRARRCSSVLRLRTRK